MLFPEAEVKYLSACSLQWANHQVLKRAKELVKERVLKDETVEAIIRKWQPHFARLGRTARGPGLHSPASSECTTEIWMPAAVLSPYRRPAHLLPTPRSLRAECAPAATSFAS